MRYRKVLIISSILAVLTALPKANAQSSYNIQLGPAIPLSDFAATDSDFDYPEYPGLAGIGINLGFTYIFQFTDIGLGLFASLDLNYNGLNSEYRKDTKQSLTDLGVDNFSFHSYFNIPISAGINYKFVVNDKFSLLCNTGLTVNFLKISNSVIGPYTYVNDWASSIGFMVGGGMMINQRIQILIDYLSLGKHDTTYRIRSESFTSDDNHAQYKIDILTIGVGWSF